MTKSQADGRRSLRIRELNDAFRSTFVGGRVVMTSGIAALPERQRTAIINRVMHYDTFNADNDPHGEHDFGSLEEGDTKAFWKIDYYDETMEFGSDDPTDPAKTLRVLTIMLANEY